VHEKPMKNSSSIASAQELGLLCFIEAVRRDRHDSAVREP
jgi:hypothetical protein